MCGEPDHRLLLTTLPSGRVILQDDGDFPGYCVLEHRRHVTELYELGEPERNQLMRDIARVARAIGEVQKPHKLNYAILGNEVPHLHCHIVPRYPDDRWWGRPIWNRPAEQRRVLDAEEYKRIRSEVLKRLLAHGEESE